MSSPLIGIPAKKTQDVDFGPTIRGMISSIYQEDGNSYEEEVASLNRCRQDALRGSAGSELTGRDLLLKYFGQLELLELRFTDLRVPFPWSDAFTHKPISQLSLAYEKASVIFNIGAILSSLAVSQPRSSPEGLKRAYNFFRQSAGMFTYINDNFLHAPSTDLSKDVINCLVTLANAQATEVFAEQVAEQKKSPALRARICNQTAHLYAAMQQDVKDFVSKGWFPRSWSFLIQAKSSYFASQAQYHKASADSAVSKYGDALRRLTMAADAAKQASAHAYTFSSVYSPALAATLPPDCVAALNQVTKNNLALCQEALNTAKKENDLIYHASLTSEASLPQLEIFPIAEPIPIQEVYAAPEVQKTVGQDIFIRLVPLSVHESASMYSEEKAQMVRAQSEAVDTADTEMVASLEYMGLPASLSRFTASRTGLENSADLGPQLRGWLAQIRQAETQGPTLRHLLAQLQQLSVEVSSALDATSRELDQEEKACESARVQHADAGFDQPPSSSQAEQRALKNDIKQRKEAIQAARSSDEQVMQTWTLCRPDAELLIDSKDEHMERIFAEAIASVTEAANKQDLLGGDFDAEQGEQQQVDAQIHSIRENIDKLEDMKRERNDLLKDLKEKVQGDDISHLLILNRKSQNIEPTLFAAELEKFKPHQSRITSTLHHQKATIADITASFKSITESKKGREIQSAFASVDQKRKELLDRFQQAFEACMEVRQGAAQGVQFYQDLSDYVSGIKSRVNVFVSQRNSERQQTISRAEATKSNNASLESSMGGLDLGAGNSPLRSPPPAPPNRPSSFSPVSSFANPQHQAPLHAGSYSGTPMSMPPPPSAVQPHSSITNYQPTSAASPYPPPPPPSQPAYPPPFSRTSYPGSPYASISPHASSAASPPPLAPPQRPPSFQSPPPQPAFSHQPYPAYQNHYQQSVPMQQQQQQSPPPRPADPYASVASLGSFSSVPRPPPPPPQGQEQGYVQQQQQQPQSMGAHQQGYYTQNYSQQLPPPAQLTYSIHPGQPTYSMPPPQTAQPTYSMPPPQTAQPTYSMPPPQPGQQSWPGYAPPQPPPRPY